jgi:hypothetical protein
MARSGQAFVNVHTFRFWICLRIADVASTCKGALHISTVSIFTTAVESTLINIRTIGTITVKARQTSAFKVVEDVGAGSHGMAIVEIESALVYIQTRASFRERKLAIRGKGIHRQCVCESKGCISSDRGVSECFYWKTDNHDSIGSISTT